MILKKGGKPMNELFHERVSIFKDATRQTKPKRIPLLSNVWSWKIIDSPYKMTEALMDYNKLAKTVFDFHEKYNFDGYLEMTDRNPIQVTYPMGQQDYVIRDEDNSINTPDHAMMMKDDEYDALSENMLKFVWEKALMAMQISVIKNNFFINKFLLLIDVKKY